MVTFLDFLYVPRTHFHIRKVNFFSSIKVKQDLMTFSQANQIPHWLSKSGKFEITLIAFLSHFIFRLNFEHLFEVFQLSVEYMAISTWTRNKKGRPLDSARSHGEDVNGKIHLKLQCSLFAICRFHFFHFFYLFLFCSSYDREAKI
jgi:hypothetical protein